MVRAKVLENPYGSGPGLYRSSPKPSEKSHERTSQTPEHQVTHCHVDEGHCRGTTPRVSGATACTSRLIRAHIRRCPDHLRKSKLMYANRRG